MLNDKNVFDVIRYILLGANYSAAMSKINIEERGSTQGKGAPAYVKLLNNLCQKDILISKKGIKYNRTEYSINYSYLIQQLIYFKLEYIENSIDLQFNPFVEKGYIRYKKDYLKKGNSVFLRISLKNSELENSNFSIIFQDLIDLRNEILKNYSIGVNLLQQRVSEDLSLQNFLKNYLELYSNWDLLSNHRCLSEVIADLIMGLLCLFPERFVSLDEKVHKCVISSSVKEFLDFMLYHSNPLNHKSTLLYNAIQNTFRKEEPFFMKKDNFVL